ncbi:MAG: manganese-binding transcriptional regulator MntR [Mariniblastus sp.]
MKKQADSSKPSEKSAPFRRTRDNHANETAEDYVEAVCDIVEEKGECRVRDLSRLFGVSHVTVSRIVSRLVSEELLETAHYRPIMLTKAGAKLAQRVKKRHQVVYDFLIAIGVDAKTAKIDSEGIEHHVSEKTIAVMKRHIAKSI